MRHARPREKENDLGLRILNGRVAFETACDASWRTLLMQLSMLCPRGGPREEVGTLNVLGHPRWGILANFEHKCWPRDREVWTILKQQKRTGFWMWGAWIRMFRHLESTGIPRSSNFPVAIKWRNKRNLTNHCFFFNIYVLLNKYFVSIPSLTCNCIFMLFFCLFVMLG